MNSGFLKPGLIEVTPEMKPVEALIVGNKIEEAAIAIVEACQKDLSRVFECVSMI